MIGKSQSTHRQLQSLIDKAKALGLPETDIKNVRDFLTIHEFGLAFDTLITQLHEHDIKSSQRFYDDVLQAGIKMQYPASAFEFLQKLIDDCTPDESHI